LKNYAHWPAVTYNIGSVVILLCVLLLLLLVFRIVGSIRLRETIAGLQEKYTLSSQMKEERSNFEAAQLDFRRVETFKQLWQAVSKAAESLGFLSLSLPLTNRDGTHHKLTWRQEVKTPNMSHEELLKISVPLRDRRNGLSLNLKAEVCKNGSLESRRQTCVAIYAPNRRARHSRPAGKQKNSTI